MSKYFDLKYDEKFIIKEMAEVVESLDFFRKNNIRIYFPFKDKNTTKEVIDLQLKKDKKENNPLSNT